MASGKRYRCEKQQYCKEHFISNQEGTAISRPPQQSPFQRGAQPPASKGPQLFNDRIRATEVRLISEESTEVVSRAEALKRAEETGLDLVVVSLDSSPPVVRLVDFGKYRYEQEKKQREAKKRQHVIEVKEIKMGVRIDDHDYDVKMQHARKFLAASHKVKLTLRLKGRETQHSELAFDLAKRFIVDCQDYGSPDNSLRLEGRTITVIMSPLKQPAKGDAH